MRSIRYAALMLVAALSLVQRSTPAFAAPTRAAAGWPEGGRVEGKALQLCQEEVEPEIADPALEAREQLRERLNVSPEKIRQVFDEFKVEPWPNALDAAPPEDVAARLARVLQDPRTEAKPSEHVLNLSPNQQSALHSKASAALLGGSLNEGRSPSKSSRDDFAQRVLAELSLSDLGYPYDPTNQAGDELKVRIRKYQLDYDLLVSGTLDSRTQMFLKKTDDDQFMLAAICRNENPAVIVRPVSLEEGRKALYYVTYRSGASRGGFYTNEVSDILRRLAAVSNTKTATGETMKYVVDDGTPEGTLAFSLRRAAGASQGKITGSPEFSVIPRADVNSIFVEKLNREQNSLDNTQPKQSGDGFYKELTLLNADGDQQRFTVFGATANLVTRFLAIIQALFASPDLVKMSPADLFREAKRRLNRDDIWVQFRETRVADLCAPWAMSTA
jgi:hypothetical protein